MKNLHIMTSVLLFLAVTHRAGAQAEEGWRPRQPVRRRPLRSPAHTGVREPCMPSRNSGTQRRTRRACTRCSCSRDSR